MKSRMFMITRNFNLRLKCKSSSLKSAVSLEKPSNILESKIKAKFRNDVYKVNLSDSNETFSQIIKL